MSNFISAVLDFFGKAEDAVKGEINGEELFKAIVEGLSAGGLGSVVAAILADASGIFSSAWLAPAVAILGFVQAIIRRSYQGK